MPRLLKWSTIVANPYQAPEVGCNILLAGEVYDHPNFEDGERIQTSLVKSSVGRLIETRSGSVYVLEGDPDSVWMDYLKSIEYDLDVQDPVKQVRLEDSHLYGGQGKKENIDEQKE